MTRPRARLSRASRINLAAVIIAVLGAIVAASLFTRRDTVVTRAAGAAPLVLDIIARPDGSRALRDASGRQVPLLAYERIASASTVSDWLVMELCDAERVIAVTQRSLAEAPWRHRFAGKRGLASLDQLESLLAMKPDLLLTDSFGDPRRVARLRESGLEVFDLGQMRGVDSLLSTMHVVGALCGHPERAQRLARRIERSLTALTQALPDGARPRALYLSPYGDKLFGGTRGTGYHDLLVRAGLRDAAADAFSDFPEYNAEQVLALDPDLIVTRAGMADALCRHTGLARLRACARPGAIVELESFSIDDPGLGLIESIESLHQAVYQ